MPTDDLVKARESIDLAQRYEPKDKAKENLETSIKTLKEAHESLPQENYDKVKELTLKSYSFSQLAIYQTLPSKLVALSNEYSEKIGKAYEANAEMLAELDYRSAHDLSAQAKTKEEALQKTALSDGEIEKLSNYKFESQKEGEDTIQKMTIYNKESIETENLYKQAIKAATIAYETSLAQKNEYKNQLSELQKKWMQAKEYGIEKTNPEETLMVDGKLKEINDQIDNNQLRLAHKNMQELKEKIDTLHADAEKKYAAELFKDANLEYTNTKNKVDESSNRQKQSSKRNKISENLLASEEALKNSKNHLDNERYSESIASSRESLNLSKIIKEMLNEALTMKNREVTLQQEEQNKVDEKIDTNKTTESTASQNNIKTIYTVKKTKPAESLWKISGKKEIYNNPLKWPKIFEANKDIIKNPNLIYLGQKLKILKED